MDEPASLSLGVAHGELIWPVIVALLVTLGAWLGWWATRAAVRRHARRSRRELGEARETLGEPSEGDHVVLAGTLWGETPVRAFGAAAEALATTAEVAEGFADATRMEPTRVHRSGDDVRLVTRDGEVALGSRLDVLAGSLEDRPGGALERRAALAQALESAGVQRGRHDDGRRVIERLLRSGDEVRVSGVLQRAPDADAGTYREAAARWMLVEPEPDAGLKACYGGAPRVLRGPSRARLVLWAMAGAAFAFASLWGIGAAALAQAEAELGRERRYGTHPYDKRYRPQLQSAAAQVAAISPFHREEVLRELAYAQSHAGPFDRQAVERLLALERERGSCAQAIQTALRHGMPKRATALAAACPKLPSDDVADAACELGRFEAASDVARSESYVGVTELRMHLLAGRVELAADTADALAKQELAVDRELRKLRDVGEATSPARVARNMRCMAAALRAVAGSADADGRLRELAEEPKAGPVCWLLAADRASERGPLLAELLDGNPDAEVSRHGLRWLAALMRLERGSLDVSVDAVRPAPAKHLVTGYPDAWFGPVARAALARLQEVDGSEPTPRRLRAALLLQRARLELLVGEHDAATATIDEAEGDLEGLEVEDAARLREHALELAPVVTLDRGDADAAAELASRLPSEKGAPWLERWIAFERGDPQPVLDALQDEGSFVRRRSDTVRAIHRGDGRELAWITWSRWNALWLLEGWTRWTGRHVRRDRGVLAGELRYRRRTPSRCEPRESIRRLAARLAHARALGDEDWEQSLSERLSAQRRALEDRRHAVPLFLLAKHRYVL